MFTVVETPTFIRRAVRLLSDDQRADLIDFLASNPTAGDLIPDTGGIRKVRYAARGKGKRGGVRVIYYLLDEDFPLYALLIYGKGRTGQSDVGPEESRSRVRGGDQGGKETAMSKARKTENVGDELIRAMGEALAHARGDKTSARVTRFRKPAIAVKSIRQKVGLKQVDFASLLGVSVSGLRKWEQGHRRPGGAALTLLEVMDREPRAVARAIGKRA